MINSESSLEESDPLAIARHFYMMLATQYSFTANIPTVSRIDILAGLPTHKLLGGPLR